MTHDASKAQRRTQPWSAQESAFLFNYVDWCLLHKKAYTEQISQAMLKHLSVQRTHSSIDKKLRSLLVGNVAGCTVSKLYEYGTSYLDLKALSPGILDAMVSQRKDLGLSELNFSDTRQIDNTNSNATALEKCFVSVSLRQAHEMTLVLMSIDRRRGRSEEQHPQHPAQPQDVPQRRI